MSAWIQSLPFDERVATLLRISELPTEDLSDNPGVTLFGSIEEGNLSGVVGLEIYESCALLRSLAVAPEFRAKGIGNALLLHAERAAARQGVRDLYLLTTTAEQYFVGHGYHSANRDVAPAAIARTRQFAGLCPSSSALMVKNVG